MHYNEALAESQGLTDNEKMRLDQKYAELFGVLYNPGAWNSPVAQVRKIEFDLQKLWKFEQDPKFHRYQLYIKGCTCPKMDNEERVGRTEDRIHSFSCPWHGSNREAQTIRKRFVDNADPGL